MLTDGDAFKAWKPQVMDKAGFCWRLVGEATCPLTLPITTRQLQCPQLLLHLASPRPICGKPACACNVCTSRCLTCMELELCSPWHNNLHENKVVKQSCKFEAQFSACALCRMTICQMVTSSPTITATRSPLRIWQTMDRLATILASAKEQKFRNLSPSLRNNGEFCTVRIHPVWPVLCNPKTSLIGG